MSNSVEANHLAQRIEAARILSGKSLQTLSDESGIAYSTLRRKLRVTPDEFKLGDVVALAVATNVEFETLFVRTP